MGECKKGQLSPMTKQEQVEFDKTVERLKGFRKGLSRGIEGERARIVAMLRKRDRGMPSYDRSYKKAADLINQDTQ